MASDADRLAEALPWIHYVPTGLLQMGVAMFLLWQLIGPALLAVRITPLKNGGDHSFGGRFGPLRNRSPVLWCHLLDS